MFDWITKPEIYWTPIDSLCCIIDIALFAILIINLLPLIINIIEFFKKGGDD